MNTSRFLIIIWYTLNLFHFAFVVSLIQFKQVIINAVVVLMHLGTVAHTNLAPAGCYRDPESTASAQGDLCRS